MNGSGRTQLKLFSAVRPRTAHEEPADVALTILAKITLSDVDNSRGYEMTVTGSGFNNGTTAGVYVLAAPGATEKPSCEMIVNDPAPRSAGRWSAATTRSQ